MKQIDDKDRLWQVELTLTSDHGLTNKREKGAKNSTKTSS